MKDQINQSNETILKLERDLSDAYSSIEAGKALLKCHSIVNEKKNRTSAGGAGSMDISTGPAATAPAVDVTGRSSNSSNSNSTILQGLLSQRDRMMKLAREKENEVNSLQIQMKDLQKSLAQLQRENPSLYQRIRTVRIERVTSPMVTTTSSSSALATQSHHRNRSEDTRVNSRVGDGHHRDEHEPGDGGDDIEQKYRTLYESNLDHQLLLHDHDKQILLSQLNPMERSFLSLIQFLIQDSFRRHSAILCLLLMSLVVLHDLAMIIVLPQMDGESSAEGLSLLSELQNEEEWETPHLDNLGP